MEVSSIECPESRQVLLDLPRGDLLVVAEPLVALDADVVVDVVLVAAATERRAEHVVRLELADCLEQGGRQRAQALRDVVGVRGGVEVLAVRLTCVELALDPVQPCRQHRGRGEVGVARSVDRAILDPAGRRDPQHLGAVVVAVRDPDR